MKLLWTLLPVFLLSGCCAGLDEEINRNKLTKKLHVGGLREKVGRVHELLIRLHAMGIEPLGAMERTPSLVDYREWGDSGYAPKA